MCLYVFSLYASVCARGRDRGVRHVCMHLCVVVKILVEVLWMQVDTWPMRRTCMKVLLATAELTGRTAQISPQHSAVYNTGHIKRW